MVFLINLEVVSRSVPVALNAKQTSISGVGLRPEMQDEMKFDKKSQLRHYSLILRKGKGIG